MVAEAFCVEASAVVAASASTAILNFIFINDPFFRVIKLLSTYITGSAPATIGFACRLAIGPEILVGPRTPVNAAGVFILLLPVIIHFLATEIAAGQWQFV